MYASLVVFVQDLTAWIQVNFVYVLRGSDTVFHVTDQASLGLW